MPINSCSVFFNGDAVGTGTSLEISESQMTFRTNKKLVIGSQCQFTIKPAGEPFDLNAVAIVKEVTPDSADPKNLFIVLVEFVKGLKDFGKLVSSNEQIAETRSIYINASAPKCYEAICDFSSYHKWTKHLTRVEKIGSNQKRPVTVRLGFNFYLKVLEVQNRYTYDDETFSLKWEMKRGALASMNGSWKFEQKDEYKTLATLSMAIVLGFYAPKTGLDFLKSKVMYDTMLAFKKYVESLP